MSETAQIFKRHPDNAVLPVIHLQSEQQAVEMAGLAKEAGAGGVFITDAKKSTMSNREELAEAATSVMSEYEDLWVGVNCLVKDPSSNLDYFGNHIGVEGVMVANASGWRSIQKINRANLESTRYFFRETEKFRQRTALYFGGLAMRGEGYIEDPFQAAAFVEATHKYVDVVTTTAETSAQTNPIERVRRIKEAIGETGRLALYGSITRQNIASYARYADYFIVGTEVENNAFRGDINLSKLRGLIHAYHDAGEQELYSMLSGSKEQKGSI